jgi:hypothetical protein
MDRLISQKEKTARMELIAIIASEVHQDADACMQIEVNNPLNTSTEKATTAGIELSFSDTSRATRCFNASFKTGIKNKSPTCCLGEQFVKMTPNVM